MFIILLCYGIFKYKLDSLLICLACVDLSTLGHLLMTRISYDLMC